MAVGSYTPGKPGQLGTFTHEDEVLIDPGVLYASKDFFVRAQKCFFDSLLIC